MGSLKCGSVNSMEDSTKIHNHSQQRCSSTCNFQQTELLHQMSRSLQSRDRHVHVPRLTAAMAGLDHGTLRAAAATDVRDKRRRKNMLMHFLWRLGIVTWNCNFQRFSSAQASSVAKLVRPCNAHWTKQG